MDRTITTIDGRTLDARYFVEWRPYLWLHPLMRALAFVGDLRGKRVLEIGGRAGRVSSLFAMLGADVTMIEKGDVSAAQREVDRWQVRDKVTLIQTDGGFDRIAGQSFDVIFTKSVLWSVQDLGPFLEEIESHLSSAGKVVFLENNKGGNFVSWLRNSVVHLGRCTWSNRYFGISADQIPIFNRIFDDVTARKSRYFVYCIFGHKKASPAS